MLALLLDASRTAETGSTRQRHSQSAKTTRARFPTAWLRSYWWGSASKVQWTKYATSLCPQRHGKHSAQRL